MGSSLLTMGFVAIYRDILRGGLVVKKRNIKWFVLMGALILGISSMTILTRKRNIQTVRPKRGDVLEAIYGLGKVATDEVFELKIGLMANVGRTFVSEGDFVEKGEKMISFDTIGVFRAPFSGTITLVQFKDGEVVSPQAPVLRLENLRDKFIEVSLEQEAALRVRPGQKAKLVFQSLAGEAIEGRVEKIYPKLGDFIARIEVDNISPHVLPGMTADVVIEVGRKKDALLIPLKAISSGKVIRRRDGKKKKIDIVTGHADGLWTELLEGDIELSDELVVKGN
jgi:macrolide-specific efflux system membrane fusion protein